MANFAQYNEILPKDILTSFGGKLSATVCEVNVAISTSNRVQLIE